MRHAYICPHCDQGSTRWWNLKTHIKRRHGGLLLDRSSDRYIGSSPPWHTPNNPYHNIGSATVADTVGNTFEPTYLRQQALGISQYSPTIDEQRYGSGLPQDAIQKIQELKRLLNKYPQYHDNGPDEILRWVVHGAINSNNKFLDEMLEQLPSIDSLAKF
jgi:hypothetical protein